MLNSIFENQAPIASVLMFSKYADLLPTPYEWSLIESLIRFLYPFKVCTNFFQTEKQVSISAIYSFIYRLKKDYTLHLESDTDVIKDIKKNMALLLQQIINEYKGEVILGATILDPR